MRKRLVALLSLVGLANSATPAVSQALNGSTPTETKTESQVKGDKVKQENAAAQNAAAQKQRKAGGEQRAQKDVVTEKIGADQSVHKHVAGVKYEKKTTESNAGKTEMKVDPAKLNKATAENTSAPDAAQNKKFIKSSAETDAAKTQHKVKIAKTNADAASKDAAKMTKAKTESTAVAQESIGKGEQKKQETSAIKDDVVHKGRKAGGEQADAASKDAAKLTKARHTDALTVKQKMATTGTEAGAGKAKLEKNAAESNAVQQDAQKKADKATPK